MNSYVCFHKGKRFEVMASSSYGAQKKCAEIHGIKKGADITVMLTEKDGEQVTHTPAF